MFPIQLETAASESRDNRNQIKPDKNVSKKSKFINQGNLPKEVSESSSDFERLKQENANLRKENQELEKLNHRLRLENDVLEKAAEVLKKAGASI